METKREPTLETRALEVLRLLAHGASLRLPAAAAFDAHAWVSQTMICSVFLAVAETRGLLEPEDRWSALTTPAAGAWNRFEEACARVYRKHGGELFAPSSRARVDDASFVATDPHVRAIAKEGALALGRIHELLLGQRIVLCEETTVVVERKRKAGEPTTDVLVPLGTASDVAPAALQERLDALGVEASKRAHVRTFAAGTIAVARGLDRRQAGSHYTSLAVASAVVHRTLAPLELASNLDPAFSFCDPAMGSGAFLVAALEWFVARGHEAAKVAKHHLYGVDLDARAVTLARHALWLTAQSREEPFTFVDHALRAGEALLAFDWEGAFPRVFSSKNRGFSAIAGNPPWVSYAGRAAQPLADEVRASYTRRFRSFVRYRNLQGLFVERSVELLASGGRLGLVLPSSMSELSGYEPVRRVHDAECVCDASLPDLGDGGFEGIFQPSMVLLSTKRPGSATGPWPIERSDLDESARSILAKMDREPLPPETFGERGLQSTSADIPHFRPREESPDDVALRVGGDVESFLRRPPRMFAPPTHFGARLRSPADWRSVAVLVRQTARFPVAALSDGHAFRNSLLACFASDTYPAAFLVAYLNAWPVRFFHYMRHRDARNGMPQVKIGHLRTIPAPPANRIDALTKLGERISRRNEGIHDAEQREIDAVVAAAFELDALELARIERWKQSV